MCTLSYIPVDDEDFYFTTNRDESPNRIALSPQIYNLTDSSRALFPKDKLAEGTWMFCHEEGFSLCLLNGAFKKHKHQPPYRKSRGVMVLEFIKYSSTQEFISIYEFIGMEPFTLLVLSYQSERKLEEVRWDGEVIHYRKLNALVPQIWSSSTLYDEEAKQMRKKWFSDWLRETKVYSKDVIFDFHKNTGNDDAHNGLVMNRRNLVKTLSVTQIIKTGGEVSMEYDDFEKGKTSNIKFKKKSLD